MEIVKYVGGKIKELRTSYGGGRGLSQEELANKLTVATNTVSRWENATYKPKITDLDKLSNFFKVPISAFFPENSSPVPLEGLMRVANGLHEDDIEALTQFAEFKNAQNQLNKK